MAIVDAKQLSARMSSRLANFDLGDDAIMQLAERVVVEGLQIGRFDPCIYGICIDYYTDKLPRLDRLFPKRGISKWEVFPYGILEWDHFRVRVAFDVDGLEGKSAMRGFQT